MKELISKLKNFKFTDGLKNFLASKYFPFLSAAVSLFCYYLKLDIVFIYYTAITGILILTLLDDVSPMISVMLFMSVLISYENSPSNIMTDSDYYFKTSTLVQIFIVIGALGSAAVFRLITACINKQFRLTPDVWGLGAFAIVLLFNGMFSDGYSAKNMVYGLVMALSFFGIFCVFKGNMKLDEKAFERIAFAFFALSLVLITELFVAYITTDDLITDGSIDRGKLTFGWGIWNTMGMMLTICIPSVTYLAGKYKYGFGFTLYSAILFVAVILSCSRQSIISAFIIYTVCLLILFIKGKKPIINICIIVSALIIGIIILASIKFDIIKYFKNLFSQIVSNGGFDGNGRIWLWRLGIDNFNRAPLLGIGFYCDIYKVLWFEGFSGMSFIPQMCHNTVIQLLSSCGMLGLLTYSIHRAQTLISFCKNVNMERTFIALTILALLIICLVDNHIFNIFPTIIYSCLVAVLFKSEQKN